MKRTQKRKHVRIGLILFSAQYLALDVSSLSSRSGLIRSRESLCLAASRIPSAVYASLDNQVYKDGMEDDDNTDVVDSPLSQLPSEEGEVEDLYRGSYTRDEKWLEDATDEFLDMDKIPLGTLTQDDVESITGLMAAWVRRRSVEAALIVEQLLKRVVDDMRANNPDVHVAARMYTIVSN
jgi:hypothetical protein